MREYALGDAVGASAYFGKTRKLLSQVERSLDATWLRLCQEPPGRSRTDLETTFDGVGVINDAVWDAWRLTQRGREEGPPEYAKS